MQIKGGHNYPTYGIASGPNLPHGLHLFFIMVQPHHTRVVGGEKIAVFENHRKKTCLKFVLGPK